MTSLIVAKRYARALLDIGREDGNLDQYGNELAQVVEMFDSAPELEAALANPGIAFADRQAVLVSVLQKMGSTPIVNNFLKLLMDRGRINALRAINTVYVKLLDEVKGITRAQVTSAVALGDPEVQRLSAALKQLAGKDVQLEIKEDPSLIGGVVARIGDLVLDGSVRSQLESLKDSLRRGDYA